MCNFFYLGYVVIIVMGGFFLVKVLYDYYLEWGSWCWLFFGVVILFIVIVVWFWVCVLKYFLIDVIVGGLIGVGMGILILEFYRKF